VSQVYIRYVVQKGVVAMPKSSCRDRIVQNADADFEIGASESAYLDRLIETNSVRYGPKANGVGDTFGNAAALDGEGDCLNRSYGSTRKWPMPGPPSDEFDATLLTFKTAHWLAASRRAIPRAGRRRSVTC
jgi:hypothetical protein